VVRKAIGWTVLVLAAAVPPPARAAIVRDRDPGKVYGALEQRMSGDARVPVIVSLHAPATAARVARIERAVGGLHDADALHIVPAFAVRARPAQIRALARRPDVAGIEEDAKAVALSVSAQDAFGISQARSQIPGLDGHGQVAAVIDSGIDPDMPDLAGKIVGWKDLTATPRDTPYDDAGHGSLVSDILAGSGASGLEGRGVAPSAELVGVKVIDSHGQSSLSLIAQGIQWAVDNRLRYGIDAINLSIGDPTACGDGKDVASQAIDAAVAAGIVVVTAAGNSGPGACTIGNPAAAASALTVGAMADTGVGGFSEAWFSSRGPTADGRTKPDISGPGVNVQIASPGGGLESGSGTSAAAPFVTGTALLMLQANPSLTPPQIKEIIGRTAVDWGAPGPDDVYGAGRLDAYAALQSAGASLGVPPAEPGHAAWSGTLTPGQSFTQGIDVVDSPFPLAVTLNGPALTDGDFDLSLSDSSGHAVGTPAQQPVPSRQEAISLLAPAPGHYTVQVLARSGSGGFTLDASGAMTPADTTAPALSTDAPADGAVSAVATPTVGGAAGTALGDFPGIVAYIRHDGTVVRRMGVSPVLGRWSAAVMPALPDGIYSVDAEQGDAAGNVTRTPARSFTVDTTPPAVTIDSGPDAVTSATVAVFALSLSEPAATARCRIDGRAWQPCGASARYEALAAGAHVFEAEATDAAGNTGPAARWPWQVTAPVAATPTATPAATPTPTPAATPRPCALNLAVPAQRLAAVRRHGLSVTVRASSACPVRLEVRLGHKVLAGRNLSGGFRSTRMTLVLKRQPLARRTRVTLSVRATSAGARTITRRVVLRR
jgi:serine protease AprX